MMPIEALWALVVSLSVLAISTSIHASVSSHRLKMANDEITAFITKIDSLKNENNEEISKISKLHKAEITRLDQEQTKNIKMAIEIAFEESEKFTKLIHNDNSLESKIKAQLGVDK